MARWTSLVLMVAGLASIAGGTFLMAGQPFVVLVGGLLVGTPLFFWPDSTTPVLDRAESEPAIPDWDVVDGCDHADAKAEPVETDVTGDGEPEVIGWLCSECGGKVSHAEAHARNFGAARPTQPASTALMWGANEGPALHDRPVVNTGIPIGLEACRRALSDHMDRVRRMVDGWHYGTDGTFVLTEQQHHEYTAAIDHANALRAKIEMEEVKRRTAIEAGVRCDGFIEVPGDAPGSRVRRYAAPGECLCGDCEVTEVRSHDGVVVRRILSPDSEVVE